MNDDKKEADSNNTGWQFKPEDDATTYRPENKPASKPLVTWTASEYIEHKKGLFWYILLFLVAVVVTSLLYLFTRDVVSSAIVFILLITLAVVAARKPRVLEYNLDKAGLAVGRKFYSYSNFKSFTLEEVGPLKSITFLPMKRFMPPISVYFAPEDENKIISALSQLLPYEQRRSSSVDNFMRSIRF